MARRREERVGVAYLAFQAIAVFAWWAWLFADPSAKKLFVGPNLPPQTLDAFLIPDLLAYVGLGGVALVLYAGRKPYAWPALVLHTGAALYATFATIGLNFASGGGWLGVGLMSTSVATLLILTWRLRP